MVEHPLESFALPDQVIRLPRFELPFPSDISSFADSIIEHTSRWAQAVGLADGQAVARLRRNGIMQAGPRLAPAASLDAAFLVCDWTVFLIVIDDEFDDGPELGVRPELAQAAIEDVIAAFQGQPHNLAIRFPHLAGIGAGAADLGRRFEEISSSHQWLTRFRLHAEDHIWSKVSEAKQRVSGAALDVASYVDLRRTTSAAYTYADLVEMAAQVAIAEPAREMPAWSHLQDAFADVWLGIQDICSCAKEVSGGDHLNLAAVMARTAGTNLQQGIDEAYQWVCRRSADFADQRAQLAGLLPSLSLDQDHVAEVIRYLNALELLLGGHLTWNSQDNPRYSQVISRT